MPSDLDYFKESDFNKGNFRTFYNNLPSEDLKQKFLKSVPNDRIRWDLTWVNQGYKGPYPNGASGDSEKLSPSYGLQEVSYWWGVAKTINLVPGAGLLVWGVSKAISSALDLSKWCSLYFDSKTGECLSHDKEIAASILNNNGVKLTVSGKYEEAREYFFNAYKNSCNKEYQDKYNTNWGNAKIEVDAMNLNLQGSKLFEQRRYVEAQSKYQEAYNKTQVSKQYDTYMANWSKAQTEIDAINLNIEGSNLFEQRRYSEAQSKYQEAYNKSQINKDTYKANYDKAKDEIDSINLNIQGNRFFEQHQYIEAQNKYQEAYEKSQVRKEYDVYIVNRSKAKIEINARNLNSEGDYFFKQGKYSEARNKYQEAYEKSQVRKEHDVYMANRGKVEIEIYARNLNSEGDYFFKQGKYSEALSKFQEAFDKSKVSKEFDKYFLNRNMAQAEKDSFDLKELGDIELSAGRYDSAKAKYQRACEKSSIDTNKTTYLNCAKKAQVEIDALQTYQSGEKLFNEMKYYDALKKYQAAYSTSNVEDTKFSYNSGIIKAQIEINSYELYQEGEALYRAGNYEESKKKYNEAIHISQVNKTFYKTNAAKAQAELDAIELNSQGDQLFRQGVYGGALDKYQAACDKSQTTKEKETSLGIISWLFSPWSQQQKANIFVTNRDKAQVEVDAMNLNYEGDSFFEQGKYSEAQIKYQEAYDRSQVSKDAYKTNWVKAQDEVDAINLNCQGNDLFEQGKYEEAQVKYQEAYDKSHVNKESNTYKANRDKVKYKSVLSDFNSMLTQDITDSDLKVFSDTLEIMIEEGYGSDSAIINMRNIISLRITRSKMNDQLKSINRENLCDLLSAIMSSIGSEMDLLKILNITDQKLEQELKSLEDKLNALDDESVQSYNDNKKVDITSITCKARKLDAEMEKSTSTLEKLGQNLHLEY
jgi:tetratricopeptide (TPR) repeat protein